MSAVSDYIDRLLSYEEYAFSWEELRENCKAPETTIRNSVNRLTDTKDIINIRKGFYLILPPRYRGLGKLPVQLYIDKLFKYLNRPYYIALYSAASLHGASHQQIQEDYIITIKPTLLDISKGNVRIRFFSTRRLPEKNLVKKKSDAGLFNASSPVLTAVDLIDYQSNIGGLNRILANLEELTEEIQPDDVNDLLTWYPHKSVLQRFGFLLDELQVGSALSDLIYEHLKKENFYPVLLSPKKDQRAGKAGNRWKIDVNFKLEADL